MRTTPRTRGWVRHSAVAAAAAVALSACATDDTAEASADAEPAAAAAADADVDEDAEAGTAETAATDLDGDLERDARYWQQLTSLFEPVDMPSMSDHRAFMLPTGGVIALHHDDMDLDAAENLNWVALGVPGTFCEAEQERVEDQFGAGFTHFHDMVNDVHGGEPGAEGVWFVHTAVRDFEAPWGTVEQGIDDQFMPTPPPTC